MENLCSRNSDPLAETRWTPSSPQKEGTVGLAYIVTNGYKGIKELPGTEYDAENWKQTLEKLKFDVRRIKNATKDETMKFLGAASRIPSEDKNCLRRYVIFVFCGHGEEGVLYSQDLEPMNMKRDILPLFFGKDSNLRMVQKLIFLDACRDKNETSEHLGNTLSELWKPAEAPAGYFTVCSTPSGYFARDGENGSAFSNCMTSLLLESRDLPNVIEETRTLLNNEAKKKGIVYVNPCYEDNLGPNSEKNLLKLSESAPVADGPPPRESYGHVKVKEVIASLGCHYFSKEIKAMLTQHRAWIMEKEYKLINTACYLLIKADLYQGKQDEAAIAFIDYFEKTHNGDALLGFCEFLREEAEEAGNAARLKDLADKIERAVKAKGPSGIKSSRKCSHHHQCGSPSARRKQLSED